MNAAEPDPFPSRTVFAARLARLAEDGAPQVRALAAWLAERPEEVAFRSVRDLAEAAGANANTVVRLAHAMGFAGYDPMRARLRDLLRAEAATDYGTRAALLVGQDAADLARAMHEAACANIDALYAPGVEAQIARCARAMGEARALHVIGVRSCYSVAHYLAYTAGMAFPHVRPTPSQPGLLLDTMSATGPEDVVVAITYAHYSAEIVRACAVARACGARLIALTDSLSAPVARDAWEVLRLPMAGPQQMPSLTGAFHLAERLLVAMIAASPDAALRLRETERRLARFGGYWDGP